MEHQRYDLHEMKLSLDSDVAEPLNNTGHPPTYHAMESSSTITGNPSSSQQYLQDECSSGFQSQSISSFPSTLPSSASTTVNEYPPQPPPLDPLTPSVFLQQLYMDSFSTDDKYLVANGIIVLFNATIHRHQGREYCHLVSKLPTILSRLYKCLIDDEYKEDEPMPFYATHCLTNISHYSIGREAILDFDRQQQNGRPSPGVQALIKSLQSRTSNVVIVAIQAIHNLLLDDRGDIRDNAKEQIKEAGGIKYIVEQLANQDLSSNHEFKMIVLDCLGILAYNNNENRLKILESGGPKLLLTTIEESLRYQNSDQLVETAFRALLTLKSLSVCPRNKEDIIRNHGIRVLTECVGLRDPKKEILKICLLTLRNLSDTINQFEMNHNDINILVARLMDLMNEEPRNVLCVLGVLANLTCNNENLKKFICDKNGVDILLHVINVTLNGSMNFKIDIIETAISALCHLLNQPSYLGIDSIKQRIACSLNINTMKYIADDKLASALDKLLCLLGDYDNKPFYGYN